MDDLLAWVRLTKTGASARRLNTLLDRFGSPGAVFEAPAVAVAETARCTVEVASKLLDDHYRAGERELALMERLHVRLVTREDAAYPALLKEIHDPPPALYVRGSLSEADGRAVAIVGSRRTSDYGRRIAASLARELVEAGYTIVSGLALGADTAAHQGAVAAGGRTLACLGCGVDVAYPYENRQLAARISESGALLSEYPMTAPPDAWHFPRRNRLISGLSLGVVVLEAPRRSGALITASCAVDQNREVFAVPGRIDHPGSRGPHALIRDGAKLVETVQDILEELEPRAFQPSLEIEVEREPPELNAEESAVFRLLGSEPKPVDDLILEASLPAGQVNAALLLLEVKGVARRLPGNAFVRVG